MNNVESIVVKKPGGGLAPLFLLAWVVWLGFLFAKVEIQIEGAQGWAASLPTWRIEKSPLLDLFWGGRPMTGYHAWVFSFMAMVFHLPLFMNAKFSLRLETRILGCLMMFWIIEDFLWFVYNPAFGMSKFSPASIPWHKHWALGMPTDYSVFFAVGLALYWFSWSSWAPWKKQIPTDQGGSK